MKYIRVKNWKKHQHYKGRTPPWIKLHAALLDDYEFECLTDINKIQLIAIWLLASRSRVYHTEGDPLLPEDSVYLSKKSGLKTKMDLEPLISSGFIIRYQSASTMLATYKHSAPTDLDVETETEKEKASSSDDDPPPNGFSPNDMARLWNEGIEFFEKEGPVLIPKVLKLTPDRKKKAAARIRDCQIDEAKWKRIIDIIHHSAFLSGEKPGKGHENWRANFDFTIKSESTLTKILEGEYT